MIGKEENPFFTQIGKRIDCRRRNHVPIVVPGVLHTGGDQTFWEGGRARKHLETGCTIYLNGLNLSRKRERQVQKQMLHQLLWKQYHH